MREVRLNPGPLPFAGRLRLAEATANELLAEPMLLSWYDGERGIESPNGVSECNVAAPTQGVWNYAAHRGGALAVWFDAPTFLFCFRDNGPDGA
jgi:hypothetical protein